MSESFIASPHEYLNSSVYTGIIGKHSVLYSIIVEVRIESLTKDGIVFIREATRGFQYESPESKSTTRTVRLMMREGTSY